MSSITSSSLRARNGIVNISGDDQTPPPLTASIDGTLENPNHHHHRHRGELVRDGPPLDDRCPICYGNFTIPCKSSCGHWYCGNCILRYWNYCTVIRPCKCPMCTRRITKLTPEASLHDQNDEDVVRVLGEVADYNCLFLGGMRGIVQKVRRSPLLLKRFSLRLMNPDTTASDFFLLLRITRYFAMILITLFMALSVTFFPTGDLAGVPKLVDDAVTILFLILRFVGIYRRCQLRQRVREMVLIAVTVYIYSYSLL